MNVRLKWSLILFLLAAPFLGYWLIGRLTQDNLQKRLNANKPIAIRFALIDPKKNNALEVFAQFLIYPKQKHAALYFINTSAFYPKADVPVRNMSPGGADYFQDLTGRSNDYVITLKRENAARLLDLAEGLPIFVENPFFIKNARFQYPQGTETFHGQRVMEYALGDLLTGKDGDIKALLDRLHRQESVLLNILWRLRDMRKKVDSRALGDFAYSLVDTNLNRMEMKSLLRFLSGDVYTSLLEAPLEFVPGKNNTPTLRVKKQGAKLLFYNFRDNLASGQFRKDSFTVGVLNGTNVSGLARRVKRFLREKGPMVLEASNYEHKPLGKTVILERAGNSYTADFLVKKTGVSRDRIFFRRRVMQVNTTLILGEDFNVKKMRL